MTDLPRGDSRSVDPERPLTWNTTNIAALAAERDRLREAIAEHRREVEERDPFDVIERSDHKLWTALDG